MHAADWHRNAYHSHQITLGSAGGWRVESAGSGSARATRGAHLWAIFYSKQDEKTWDCFA